MRPGLFAVLALAIIAAGILFRLRFITDSDLWLDEIWSVNSASAHRTTRDVVASALADSHPPLYDILLHWWLCITPDVPEAGRYLSLLFGIAGLFLTACYVRRISGSGPAALFAASLLALNHFHAAHSIEARYYALVYLVALGTISHLILYLRGGSRVHLGAVGLWALALLYTHLYGAFLLAALGASVVVLAFARKVAWNRVAGFVVVSVGLGLAYAPFMLMIIGQPVQANVAWMQRASPAVFFEYLYNYSNKNPVEALVTALPLLLCFRVYRSAPVVVIVSVGAVVGTALIGYTLSVLRQPMLHERYTMVYFPALVILAAVFWERAAGRWRYGLALVGAAVALSASVNLGLVNQFGERLRHEPWRAIADTLRSRRAAGGERLVFAEEPQYINYYSSRTGAPVAKPVGERQAAADFWYVRTEYDRQAVPGSDTLDETERISFSGKFALLRYAAKPDKAGR